MIVCPGLFANLFPLFRKKNPGFPWGHAEKFAGFSFFGKIPHTSNTYVMPWHQLLPYLSLCLILSCQPAGSGQEVARSQAQSETSMIDQRLNELGIELPEASSPVANYVNAVRTGNLLFLAGKGPDESFRGKVGVDLTVEEAYQAARSTGLNQLAVLKAELGSLDRVVRIVKVLGMVNAPADFTDHPAVINGFSDLMVEVFGDRGKHARAAVGMGSLPSNIPVEIEMIVEVE